MGVSWPPLIQRWDLMKVGKFTVKNRLDMHQHSKFFFVFLARSNFGKELVPLILGELKPLLMIPLLCLFFVFEFRVYISEQAVFRGWKYFPFYVRIYRSRRTKPIKTHSFMDKERCIHSFISHSIDLIQMWNQSCIHLA